MAYYDLTFNVIGATIAHDNLTFNVIGATMAHDDLTFNVIGATMESPSQNPLACLYKPRVCGNKTELLRRNPCRSPRGWVGGQQAHLSSGPLGFAEGSSTASLFLRGAPHRILVELFQILKDDAVKVLPLICQQIWKTQ